MNEITKLRKEIDAVDRKIIKQLSRRMELVLKVKEKKKENDLPIEDATREEQILSTLQSENLSSEFLKDIYTVIFNYSKSKQK